MVLPVLCQRVPFSTWLVMEVPLVSAFGIVYRVKCVHFIVLTTFLGPEVAWDFMGMALGIFEKLLLQLDIIILFLIL